jgi:hypothetical protein
MAFGTLILEVLCTWFAIDTFTWWSRRDSLPVLNSGLEAFKDVLSSADWWVL